MVSFFQTRGAYMAVWMPSAAMLAEASACSEGCPPQINPCWSWAARKMSDRLTAGVPGEMLAFRARFCDSPSLRRSAPRTAPGMSAVTRSKIRVKSRFESVSSANLRGSS